MTLVDQLDLLTLPEMRGCLDRRALEAAIRRRCHTVQVDPATTLCRVLGRYKFYVDSRDTSLAPHLMLDGYWEFWITDIVWRNLEPGDVAYDVGANLGYYSVLMGELVGPGGALLAFEPNPRMAQLLRRNLELNGMLDYSQALAKAVTTVGGQKLRFHASQEHPKNGTLILPSKPPEHETVSFADEVETVALDDFADRPADFIKVDVEGAEEQVWAGMQKLLDASPRARVLFEFNAHRCKDARGLLQDMARRYPLRQVGDDALVRPSDLGALLECPQDTMLYLSDREPVTRAQLP